MPAVTNVTTPPMQRRSLELALGGHNNSFGLLRLVLASMVILNHAYPLGGLGEDPIWQLTRGQGSFGSLAVLGFFALSGYLIGKSAGRLDTLQYFWHRALRIFPAYWGALIVGAFVVGPLVWVNDGNPLSTYVNLDRTGPINYVWSSADLTIETFGIHNVLAGTPYGLVGHGASVLNGSIWTLIYEWRCYVIVAVLALGGLLTKNRVAMLALVSGFAGLLLIFQAKPGFIETYIPLLADVQLITLAFVFLTGSLFAAYRDRIVFDHRLGLFAIFAVAWTLRYGGFAVFGHVAAVYAILYVAAALPKVFQRVGAKNDYSYGIYVYGFLVQQVLAYLGVHKWGYVPYVALALVVSAGLAWLSWHGIEKRALAIKSWGPGKGIAYWWQAGRRQWNARRA